MQTHEFKLKLFGKTVYESPFFWHTLELKKQAPVSFTSKMWEDEEPYRASGIWIIKFWTTKAIAFGWWRDSGKAAWDYVAGPVEVLGEIHLVSENVRNSVRDDV